MTFDQILDQVLADGFSSTKREPAKEWVNAAYQWLWDAEEWSFRTGVATVGVTAGSANVGAMPTDFGIAVYLLNSDGEPLRPIQDVRQFYALYGDGEQGVPEAFTVVGATSLRVGPVSSVTESDWQLVYEKQAIALSNGTDVPSIPGNYHMGIVQKARAEGMRLLGIPLWQGQLDAALETLDAMRQSYLSPIRGEVEQVGAFRPDLG